MSEAAITTRRGWRSHQWLLRLSRAVVAAPWTFLFWLLGRLNDSSSMRVGRLAVTASVGWLRFRRLANIKKVFGPLGWSRAQCRELNRAAMRHFARLPVDLSRLTRMSGHELRAKFTLEGEEHIRVALQRGKGILLIGNHMGTWHSVYAALGAHGYRLTVAANRSGVPGLDEFLDGLTRQFGHRVAYVGEKAAIAAWQAFRRNELFCTLLDVSVRRGQEVWLPFGHAALSVDRGIAQVALLQPEVPILLITVCNGDNQRATVTVQPAPTAPDGDTLLRGWLDRVYEEVRQRPEQWWAWSFVVLRAP